MMISPEVLIKEKESMSYKELLVERDKLLEEIFAFEKHTYDPDMDMIMPSPEVKCPCDLKYLGKLCELIAEKYCSEYVWEEE